MSLSQITELDLDSGKTKFYKQEVLDLYYRVLCNSNSWDLGLGFFSLSSIKLLAYPLAKFILNNNGKMRVYCNERLSENDYNIISENKVIPLNKTNVFNDLNTLYDSLKGNDQELFSQCITFLIQTDRIEFKVLVCKDSSRGISHHKNSIFKDDNNNTVVLSGSANASEQAFIFNREDTNAFCSFWNEKSSNKTINTTINEFEKTFHEGDEDWNILDIDSKELKGKLDEIGFRKIDSLNLDKKAKSFSNSKKNLFSKSIHDEIDKEIKTINDQPHFPIFDGIISKPRKYQIDAYNAWVNNNYSGIFAMATGTGKTITSLNCILNHYLATSNYHVIILVPTNILVSQWEKEANKFNFSNVYSSLNNKWLDELRSDLFLLNNKRGENFIFITTYSTFNGKKFQDILKFKDLSNLVLLADEVHNLGSKKSLNNLPEGILKRIGLSATPNRKYDENGTLGIENYFDSRGPCYTYSYSMTEAIENGHLTNYKYYPYLTYLNDKEIIEYKKISLKLLNHFDFKTYKYRESAELLLIKRKRIIHQATNKKIIFKNIIDDLKAKGNLSHTLVYVPEGFDRDYSGKFDYDISKEDNRIINDYSRILYENDISTYQMLGETINREEILTQFENGKIKTLTAMKTLDEGVDIPATRNAIFCASTGNPRQFIQRRGRILRKFKGKDIANIYDIIIGFNPDIWIDHPPDERKKILKMELNIFKSELYRVSNFLYASLNRSDISLGKDKNLRKIVKLAENNGINLDLMINELIMEDNNCK